MGGPILAVGLAGFGILLGLPNQPSQIEDLITSRNSLTVWIVYGVLFAPAFEELVFRGFLLPLISRSVGPWPAIVLTAIPFGLLHGAQNHWAWQPVVLISVAGAIFGAVRYKTGSTASAFVLHAAYNATEFGLYAVTHWAALR
jgi:membrane protease YdiL (CAAX protease family)